MVRSDRRDRAKGAERLGRSATDWILRHDGAEWSEPSLYHGQAGILLALNEAHSHFDDPGYANAVDRGGEVLAASLDEVADCSLYFGLTGIGFTLHAIGRDEAADKALRLVQDRCRMGSALAATTWMAFAPNPRRIAPERVTGGTSSNVRKCRGSESNLSSTCLTSARSELTHN